MDHARPVAGYVDSARFDPDDPEEIVRAALACPYCLSDHDVSAGFIGVGCQPRMRCLCHRCQQDWVVFLSPAQALRLGLLDTLDRFVA